MALSSLCGGACEPTHIFLELSCFVWDRCRSPLLSDQTYQTLSPSQAPTPKYASAACDSACAWACGEGRAFSHTMISREMVLVMFMAQVSTAQTFRALRCQFPKHPPTSCTWVKSISWIHAGGTAVTLSCDMPGAAEVFNWRNPWFKTLLLLEPLSAAKHPAAGRLTAGLCATRLFAMHLKSLTKSAKYWIITTRQA